MQKLIHDKSDFFSKIVETANTSEPNQKLTEKLPSYESATTLPSYEDFQEIKKDELRREAIEMFFGNVSYSYRTAMLRFVYLKVVFGF